MGEEVEGWEGVEGSGVALLGLVGEMEAKRLVAVAACLFAVVDLDWV
jgi:hypothetical protein